MTEHSIDKKQLGDAIIEQIKTVFDPEIPVNIYELGLIYEIKVDDDAKVEITMTLTSPNCPMAEDIPVEVKEKTEAIAGVRSVFINLTFEPPWDRSMMSEAALVELGLD